MITSRMDGFEIHREFMLDFPAITSWVEWDLRKNSSKITRAWIKSSLRKPIYLGPRQMTTSRGNTYYFVISIPRPKKDKNWPYSITIYTILVDERTGKKVVYMMPSVDEVTKVGEVGSKSRTLLKDLSIIVFPYHYFRRYSQRFLKEDPAEIKIEELAFKFFRRNEELLLSPLREPAGENEEKEENNVRDKIIKNLTEKELITGISEDGISLGYYNPSLSIRKLNTFITSDMLWEDQAEKILGEELGITLEEFYRVRDYERDFYRRMQT